MTTGPKFRTSRAARAGAVAMVIVVAALAAAQPASRTGTVDPRLAEAIGWYTGTAGRVDDARAQALLTAAAADGDPVSEMWLARCYSRGRMGLPRDEARARTIAARLIAEIRRLADTDHAEAVFLRGTAYDEGLGEAEDAARAAAWFHRAADLGHVLAQHNLGNLYVDGRGVPQSDAIAVYWWRKAADAGDAIPQWRLGRMYEDGRGVVQDRTQALHWYRQAAARGHAQAREAIARLSQ